MQQTCCKYLMVGMNDPLVASCVNCTCRLSMSQLRSSVTDGKGDQQVSGLHFMETFHICKLITSVLHTVFRRGYTIYG